MLVLLLSMVSGQMLAQGFLKKLKKAAENVTEIVDPKAANDSIAPADTVAAKKIDWDALPVYQVKQIYEVNEGDTVRNEDGTPSFYVVLEDQFGNRRTPETVKAQQKKVNDAVVQILLKVGGGALVGGLVDGGKGALVGAGVGALASIEDIKQAKRWKKVLNQQKKMLDALNENFTDEGRPKHAEVNPMDIADLNLDKSQVVSETTEKIKLEAQKAKDFEASGEDPLDGLLNVTAEKA